MAFDLSPSVTFREFDLTLSVPAVSTTAAAFAGFFEWGPVSERVVVTDENTLRATFGLPAASLVGDYWWSAANFLRYGSNLTVVRALPVAARNANAGSSSGLVVGNADQYVSASLTNAGEWLAKYPGVLGNSIGVSVCGASAHQLVELVFAGPYVQGADYAIGETVSSNGTGSPDGVVVQWIPGNSSTGGRLVVRTPDTWTDEAQAVTGATSGAAYTTLATAGVRVPTRAYDVWEFRGATSGAPGTSPAAAASGGANDEIHVVVYDATGLWTGTRGTVLEVFEFLSIAPGAKNTDNTDNYYRTAMNNRSRFVWVGDTASGFHSAAGLGTLSTAFALNGSDAGRNAPSLVGSKLSGGVSGDSLTDGELQQAWDMFADKDVIDVSLLITGPASRVVSSHVLAIADARQDCVAFISPERDDVVGVSSESQQTANVIDFRNGNGSTTASLAASSYGFCDSGWALVYDKFNGYERWLPLNPDVAGLAARTDATSETWFSFAGFNRGSIANKIRLAYNPTKASRDALYSVSVNPVVSFPGQGVTLFGDRTMLIRNSAFRFVNVRRLFILMEKAIVQASRFNLFEINDAFSRSQFRNLVEPFLRDIRGRQGIESFQVICDESNNGPDIVNNGQFVGDIYVKPNRSINNIRLNFIATPSGVSFDEIVGARAGS